MLSYLCEPRPWVNKIIAIAHNAKAFDLQFILNRAILLKWRPELIMNGRKIMCMKMEHLVFLDSVSFLPCSLRKLPKAFGLTASKSWYTHYFNTEDNLDYFGPIPNASYYGANEMNESERRNFFAWYEIQKKKGAVFDNRRVLETYCQDDVTVSVQILFRREFIQIGKREVFLEAITIASACNKVLRKQFLKPDTIGLIPTGGYSGNVNYSKKSLMWLVYRERQTGVARYCTGAMDASTGCQISLTLVWTVSARRQGPCTNFSAVTTTVIRANPTVTSLQLEGIP